MAPQPVLHSWRRAVRLSVRGLIVLVLVLGAFLGWLVRSAQIQRDAVTAIKQASGVAFYERELRPAAKPRAIKWLVANVGIEYFSAIESVTLGVVSSPDPNAPGRTPVRNSPRPSSQP